MHHSALTLSLHVLVYACLLCRWTPSFCDTSELSLGSGLGYSAPSRLQRGDAQSSVGLHQPNLSIKTLTTLGFTARWSAGASLSWSRSARAETPTRSAVCSGELSCYEQVYLSSAQAAQATLRLSYTPHDHISPHLWWEGGAWGRWRDEGFELLEERGQRLTSRALPTAHWWGYSLAAGGGIYWRFMSRWSTLLSLGFEYNQALNEASAPALHNLYIEVTLWLNYHRYLRLL